MAEEILRMTNITKRFAGITALDRVEFSCNKGEVHILAGENGAGKSTILKFWLASTRQMRVRFISMAKRLLLKARSTPRKWELRWYSRN